MELKPLKHMYMSSLSRLLLTNSHTMLYAKGDNSPCWRKDNSFHYSDKFLENIDSEFSMTLLGE